MTAFRPIPPSAAVAMLDAPSIDARIILSDLAAAGLVRGYARLLKTQDAEGTCEVRDSRMSRETWERIIAHDKIDDVFSTGSVRIPHGSQDDGPRLTAIGIRFDANSIASAATEHGLMTAKAVHLSTFLEPAPDPSPASAPLVTSKGIKRHIRIIPQGALQLTIDEAMAVLAVGRTTLYKLINDGTLEMKKTDGRSHVTTLSVRTYMER